jgi:HSP20 family protein
MAKKPSFLERLTGVIEEEDAKPEDIKFNKSTKEDEPETPAAPPITPPVEKIKETIKEEPPKEMESEKTKFKKIKKVEPIMPAPEEQKPLQEWMPESEGQLTIDVYQTPLEIVIKSTIAGVSAEDLDITITNDMVTIKGKREKDEAISEGDYYYQECYWGAFSRSVILPVDVEAEKAVASMKNGILTIRLPKIEKVKTRKIKVVV